MVLPQTTLGQISMAPWTDQPTPRKIRKKLKNKQQKQKRHIAKRAGHPEHQRVGEGNPL
jgi:hypothetical protein